MQKTYLTTTSICSIIVISLILFVEGTTIKFRSKSTTLCCLGFLLAY